MEARIPACGGIGRNWDSPFSYKIRILGFVFGCGHWIDLQGHCYLRFRIYREVSHVNSLLIVSDIQS